MECFQMKYVALHQIATVNALECMSDLSARGKQGGAILDPTAENIIRPEPRRAAPASFISSCYDGYRCNTQRKPTEQREDASFEILDIILTKNGPDNDEGSNLTNYFCGSPPARTNNPMVHDVEFVNQSRAYNSPFESSLGGKPSARVENRSSSCGASFGGKPMVRIEGFACSNSKSHRFVPALA
ncbi:uncharacterized protein LOC116258070 [Nymphaea colorata]|nr:uncharacterized protein LOC116258070 [Nymphaea colorata]